MVYPYIALSQYLHSGIPLNQNLGTLLLHSKARLSSDPF